MNVTELQSRYATRNPDGHYFDRATLRFFGSSKRQAVVSDSGGSGLVIRYSEYQRNAPDGVDPWRCQLFTLDGDEIPCATATGPTRAVAAHTAVLALRYTGAGE